MPQDTYHFARVRPFAGGLTWALFVVLSIMPAIAADTPTHWAFRPLVQPPLPPVKNSGWCRNPIDRFILAKLEEKGMSPSPPADMRTLLRRIYFDLIGLPPTPEQMRLFLADRSPDAYERVVDGLLASPRYGERWARHWMDVVHFAETHGNDQDRERPNAWPYRDYLIRSFNEDKPYGQFAREQVAGDVLRPDDPQAIIATGFLAAGPWDESSQLNIMDDTVDKKNARNLDRDDMVTVTMNTFVSMTVQCARCHNHKFDPITQKEYYGLQSVFAGVDRAERAYDTDPAVSRERHALMDGLRGLDTGKYLSGACPTDTTVRAQTRAWEKSLAAANDLWKVLAPVSASSSGGAMLTPLPDGSILSSGLRPDKDTYTITAATELKSISAIRLELLTDDSLPHHGPGRQDNGNLHVNELFLKAATTSNPSLTKDVEFSSATADFDQQGWTCAMAIDRRPDTAWGIYPQIGKPHSAVFMLKEPIKSDGQTLLTFVIEQTHGEGHLIGRLRLSATGSAAAALPTKDVLPDAIRTILGTPNAQRSEAQSSDLATFYLRTRIQKQLAELPPQQKVYAAAHDFKAEGNFTPAKTPRPIFVLKRGDVNQPGEEAKPGALACVPGPESQFRIADPANEGDRRAALAAWIADPGNVLTWRSIANRVWHYHFGRGIAATPSDFGRMGTAPTHPELLDWLAMFLLQHGQSLKELHRIIVTSAAYRQSSAMDAAYAKLDASNQLFWRANSPRLDAECIHDSVLEMCGLLDTAMGGPSVKEFVESPGIHVTPLVDYSRFDVDAPQSHRRSVYRFVFRTLPDPFMDAMDCPDASQLTPVRNISFTALQALAMWNDKFLVRYSEHLSERIAKDAGDLPHQVAELYELCLNRGPTADESQAVTAYASKHGLANACRVLLNSNEFIFVD